ncbi:protein-glutamine gamma-glutamyltransferase 5 [Oryzias latipes]|uniref:protein-glutamine gamma-glutamyltransferase n=2 Tax=Oryzias latipes TaxID=8090 RepID=H2LP41_ORYLA|nr:protein-glutamine gamma-glutamyltransferase 5 [Oryzias latipes]
MEGLSIQNVNLEHFENLERHKTQGFLSSKALVVRRGEPFRITVYLRGRPFNPRTDSLKIKIMLGRLSLTLPVTSSQNSPLSDWNAYFDPKSNNFRNPSILIRPSASAPVGYYEFQLFVVPQNSLGSPTFSSFVLLCNPWCSEDSVFLPFEDQREEYVLRDYGLVFMGTPMNTVSRPWSYDLYESGVLEACMNLLEVSPQHQRNPNMDYLERSDPVYIGRVVSAMVNSEDDRGVVKGNWSDNFDQGVHPSLWTGSGDILRQWAQSGFSPVKYGQCWVFAAVMCTAMRVLGIPCRVITNYNSAHDANGNLVIEEVYNETGQKLNLSRDSIWNFHVWVECWMTRKDLGSNMDGWQVLDPTPQERSKGVYCCGPAPVKAIRSQRTDVPYDVPFVYAEVNADVHTIIMAQGKVINVSKDTERVGALICTKAVGVPRLQDITGSYKYVEIPAVPAVPAALTISSRSSTMPDVSTMSRAASSKGVLVSTSLDKSPVVGEPIRLTVKVTNRERVAKKVEVHINAQAKDYSHNPSDTFWENHDVIQLGPMEGKVLRHQILPEQYEDAVGDKLINLAVVLQDMSTLERILTSEEFNIVSPDLIIQVVDKNVVPNKEHTAIVTFTNPFTHPVSGVLTVTGAGLLQEKIQFRIRELRPGGRVENSVKFTPKMVGRMMLHASLSLSEANIIIRGFVVISVNSI